MKRLLMCSAIVLVAACASTPAYGPAAKSGAMGYESLQIENNRFRVSYTDTDAAKARDRALLRAAEVTLEQGAEWFEVTSSYSSDESVGDRAPRSSVTIGGSSGSYGRSSVGVGVLATKLIAPPVALFPNRVPCGPFSTSTRWRSKPVCADITGSASGNWSM